MKRKDWTPTKSTVLCSEHFSRDAFKRPPGLGKVRAMLKNDAVPTIFPAHPTYMLTPQPKKRRKLLRVSRIEPPATIMPTSTNDPAIEAMELLTENVTPRRRGRPKQDPAVRIPKLTRRIATLKTRVCRLRKKARIQQNLLGILQKENQIQNTQISSIDGCLNELVKNEAINRSRKTNRVYSEAVKAFAITMHYYSPKAYAYLKSNFTLPNARTIRRWLESVDCEPGFLTDIIKLVSTKTRDNVYSLVIDSMSIRKRLILEKSALEVKGHVTIGDKSKMASEALVFLLVPVVGGVRHPIGYFYVDKVDSEVQHTLIDECLKLTAEHGLRIVNVTCDGAKSNIATLRKLGASIPDKPYFKHPTMPHKVYVSLDAVHMLKLARNAFGTLRKFKTTDGIIDYKYIEQLNDLQEEMGLRLANKLTKRHMNWKNMKMKVKLAAEMLSSSVADALEYLCKVDEKFKDASPTITFIRQVRRKKCIYYVFHCIH